jgi:TolB protein
MPRRTGRRTGASSASSARRAGGDCDAQYVLDLDSGKVKLVSSGEGRTTCGYFDFPAGDR